MLALNHLRPRLMYILHVPDVSKHFFPYTETRPAPVTLHTSFPSPALRPRSPTSAGGILHPSVPGSAAVDAMKCPPSCWDTSRRSFFYRLFGTDLTLWMSASSPAHGIQSVHGEIFWMNKEWNRTFRQFAISKTHLHRYILNASEEKQSCVREINIPLP